MSKHQHFIPRSYLTNFAIEKDEKHFVEAKAKDKDVPEEDLISIRDICVKRDLYTFPKVEGDDKYLLEKYYAENIDGVYPEVYDLLVNPKQSNITPKQRTQIVMTTMSLFFRTPKFINLYSQEINRIIDSLVKNNTDKKGFVKFSHNKIDYNFHISEIDNIKNEIKIQNKTKFIQEHLDAWNKFGEFKLHAGLSVYHVYEEIDLITSDNPVVMHSVVGNEFSVFDPSNIISLPLDNKHYLTIFPNSEPARLDMIFREERDKWFAHSINVDIERNSEKWILGKPDSIKAHLKDKITLGEHSKENIQAIKNIEEKLSDRKIILSILQKHKTIEHPDFVNKIKELSKKEIYKDDPEMKKYVDMLNLKGLL